MGIKRFKPICSLPLPFRYRCFYPNLSRISHPNKICWKGFLIISFVIYGVLKLVEYDDKYWNPERRNYFMEEGKFHTVGFTVNTQFCQIPDLNPFDPSILPFIKVPSAPSDCKLNRRWSYVSGQNIVLNLSAIRMEGFSFKNLHCCYNEISRVEQSLEKYDDQADSVIKVSSKCRNLGKEINSVGAEFIRVICNYKIWPFHKDVLYRNYHALVQSSYRRRTAQKIEYWEQRIQQAVEKPPNILVLGMDSMSKLNFQRTMRKTREFLIGLGAVEMHGYAKVGENTFPNAVALLSGLNVTTLEKICYFTPLMAQDDCPYIWKEFNQAGYLTAHLEDSPAIAIFNRLKTGFVEQQVDFYNRPLMQSIFGPLHSKDCVGPDTVEEKTFDYIQNIASLSETRGVPYFIFTWLTSLSHRDMGAAKHADDIFKRFLESLNLNETILFFISDHGFRYGAFRETFHGWFEDKLPNFWVYLPPTLTSTKGKWHDELILNSRKLTSPFDLYHTFRDILRTFAPFSLGEATEVGKIMKSLRTHGNSLFGNVVLNRSCADAGIPQHFCPCGTPIKIPLNSPELLSAATSAVHYINHLLPQQCSQLTLVEITAGAMIKNGGDGERNFVVAFMTSPGSFLFEATVSCDTPEEACKIKGDVLRMNKISRDVSCVKNGELEMLCYCL